MAMNDIRTMNFQTTDGDVYEVVIKRNADASITGVGRKLGVATKFGSVPTYNLTEISFVVLTSAIATVFGPAARLDSYLCHAAIFDASNPAAGGAALTTLLV